MMGRSVPTLSKDWKSYFSPLTHMTPFFFRHIPDTRCFRVVISRLDMLVYKGRGHTGRIRVEERRRHQRGGASRVKYGFR